MDTKRLHRLITIDSRLANGGLHLPSAARELGVTVRTLWRDMEMLKSAGCRIECQIVMSRYLHFHIGERLFNAFYDVGDSELESAEMDFHHA